MALTFRKEQADTLRICLVSREYPTETGWGGIGTYTYELAHGLAEKGHSIHVIALSLDHDREYKDGKVHVHRIAHRNIFFAKRILLEFLVRLEYSYRLFQKIKEITKEYGIDIVEVPSFFAEGFVCSLFKNVPLVTRLHTPYHEIVNAYGWAKGMGHRLGGFLEDVALQRSDAVTTSTKICAIDAMKRLKLAPEKVKVIPLGISLVDKKVLNGEGEAVKASNPEVLFLGRLERRKGVHVLMRAIPLVLKSFPVHFTIIGRDTFTNDQYTAFVGAKEKSFKERVLKDFPRRYLENVRFEGFIKKEALPPLFQKCDLFVAPSLYESFGLIYIEAMSYGKPVIGCGVGGVAEVVQDGETGLLVPPEDPERLAQAIIRLLKDPAQRAQMGRNARRHVEDHFTRELMVERTLEAYKKVLNAKRR